MMEPKNQNQDSENIGVNRSQNVDKMSEDERRKLINEISTRFLVERAEVYKALAKGVES